MPAPHPRTPATWLSAIDAAKTALRPERASWTAKGFSKGQGAPLPGRWRPAHRVERLRRSEVESLSSVVLLEGEWEKRGLERYWTVLEEQVARQEEDVPWVTVGEDEEGCDVEVGIDEYIQYAKEQRDDDPLCVVDENLWESFDGIQGTYTAPPSLHWAKDQDPLETLDADECPPNRWLEYGTVRGGAVLRSFPSQWYAWSGLVLGSRRWVCFDPHSPAIANQIRQWRLVYDGCDAGAMSWFMEQYQNMPERWSDSVTEFAQQPGDVVLLPKGMVCCVLNESTSLAVTHTFTLHKDRDAVFADL